MEPSISEKLQGVDTPLLGLFIKFTESHEQSKSKVNSGLATQLFKMGLVYPVKGGWKLKDKLINYEITLDQLWDLRELYFDRLEKETRAKIRKEKNG